MDGCVKCIGLIVCPHFAHLSQISPRALGRASFEICEGVRSLFVRNGVAPYNERVGQGRECAVPLLRAGLGGKCSARRNRKEKMELTYHERKAKAMGLDLAEDDIRFLFYIWSVCKDGSYCEYMQSETCFAHANYIFVSTKLEREGFLEGNPSNSGAVRLTAKGLQLFYDLQA